MQIKINKKILIEEVNRKGTEFSKDFKPNKLRVKSLDYNGKAKVHLDPNSPRGKLNNIVREIRRNEFDHRAVADHLNITDPVTKRLNALRGDNSADIARDHHLTQAQNYKNYAKHILNNPKMIYDDRALSASKNVTKPLYIYKGLGETKAEDVNKNLQDINPIQTTNGRVLDKIDGTYKRKPYLNDSKIKLNNNQSAPYHTPIFDPKNNVVNLGLNKYY